MSRFFSLTVASKIQETADSVSISFEVPKNLEKHFHFKQGQYLTLKAEINGEEIRRSYSLCSSPYEGKKRFFKKKHTPVLRVGVKAVDGGKMSNYLCKEVKVGDSIQMMSPMGRFSTDLDPNASKNYVMIAAGSGITPVLSHIKSMLYVEPNSTVVLNYGNRSEGSIMFKDELDQIKAQYPNRFFVYHFLSKNESQEKKDDTIYGRIEPSTAYKIGLKHQNEGAENHFFVCGPGQLIDETVDYLKVREVSKSNVHVEYFTSSAGSTDLQAGKKGKTRTNGSTALITFAGLEYEVDVKPGQNILDAVMAAEIDAPFSCQSGVCCTCIAKTTEGEFDTSDCISLSEDEKQDGMVLTCVTKILSDKAVINYDEA